MRIITPGGVLALLTLLIICMGGFFAWMLQMERSLDAKTSALRAAGQPVCLADLAHALPPAETNAATLLRHAQADRRALAVEIEANCQKDPDYKAAYDQGVCILFPPSLQESMAKSFAAHPDVIPLLQRAAACDEFDLGWDYSATAITFSPFRLEDMNSMRDDARVLRGWALLEASQGRPDEGLRACGTLFRLATLFDRDPFILSRLVVFAIRGVAFEMSNTILQSTATSPAARESLRKNAELEDLISRVRAVIAGERALGVSELRELRELTPAIGSLLVTSDVNSYLDVMGAYWDDASKAPNLHAMTYRGDCMATSASLPVKDIIPAVQAYEDLEVRTLAQTRCLMVLLAAQDQPVLLDKDAPTIDDLALPPPLTIDPYTGKKLTLRKVPGGWLIYSTGNDMKDDGGKISDYSDVGFAPPSPPRRSKTPASRRRSSRSAAAD